MAVARPTCSVERPRPPEKRRGRCAEALAEVGAGRRRKIRALKVETWRARRWWARRVRVTLRVKMERKGGGVVDVGEGEGLCGVFWGV